MKLKIIYIIAGIGIVLSIMAAFLYLIDCNWSGAIGAVSTIISIVLGIVSMLYTYISGKETVETLEEMKRQNRRLVDKINHEISKGNFNEDNIEYIKSVVKKEI